jgi:fructose-1,6-bisphosphatase
MPHRRTTYSKFIIETIRKRPDGDMELTALLNDVMTACKLIAVAVSHGAGETAAAMLTGVAGEPPETVANQIMLSLCEFGGQLCGISSRALDAVYSIPEGLPRGRYLLVFDPLDGASNIDVNMPVSTIFSVLRAPHGCVDPAPADFLRPGAELVAAGYALYGPVSMLVITLGDGVHGFTLHREIGAYTLTHPGMRISDDTREFAIDASNARSWEPAVRRYIEECVEGLSGPRGEDFAMRWIASMGAELHRILLRGGMFLSPRDTRDPSQAGRVSLLYQANPLAMIVEQAGGAASTGRSRVLSIVPECLQQKVPLILGPRREVARVEQYHATYDRGEPLEFKSPLFQTRSLFRT